MMDIDQLPTKGRYYGSGEAVTEFNALVDGVMGYRQPRCDCDGGSRCTWCILNQELICRKEVLKKKIMGW